MGHGGSKDSAALSEHTALIMAQYNLRPRHLRTLQSLFGEMDENKTGRWTIIEFSHLLNVGHDNLVTPCLEALVKFGSSTKDGRLSFEDFLVATCSFCALSKEEILQFVYILIDADRSGILDREELENFYSASVYAKKKNRARQAIYPPNYMTALSEFGGGQWKSLVYEEFCLMCDLFPHLAFPALHLQMLIRREILGSRFWRAWDSERLKIFHLEAESKTITFHGPSLLTGKIVEVVKPGRITMKEIFEFTKRKGLRKLASESGIREKTDTQDDTFTKSRDAVLKRAPLLNLIRNSNSVYHVPLANYGRADTTQPGSGDARMLSRASMEAGFLGALDNAGDNFIN